VADQEAEIVAAGAEIVWVLEADQAQVPGTADSCMRIMDDLDAEGHGWCVGDGQTLPKAGVFDDSPFSVSRGFDMIVAPETMEILWVSSHGSPSGNENLDGTDVLAAVEAAVDNVRGR